MTELIINVVLLAVFLVILVRSAMFAIFLIVIYEIQAIIGGINL
jgi:hypothetical protein